MYVDALDDLLESGDYGDLKKGNIAKASQKMDSAMQDEQQAADALEKSLRTHLRLWAWTNR